MFFSFASTSTCRALRSAALPARSHTKAFETTLSSFRARPQPQWRAFGCTSRRDIAVSEMSERDLSSLKVNQYRLMNDIHSTSEWGKGEPWGDGPTEIGMARLSLSDTDKQARDWFAETTQALGCKVHYDAMGNQFAVRPGLNEGHPTYAGSHLDTQPSGGRYDGILGVTAAVEMLKVMNDNWVETTYPVGVVNWTNEEGARFPMSMMSSGVWAESVPLEKAHNLKSVIPANDTATVKSELERIGYLGSTPASYQSTPMAAHFELHIEQGPILEAEQRRIGVVKGVQAYKWFTLTVKGRDSHTGATSFAHRADSLLTASKLILASHKIAHRHKALASTGILTLKPGSTNTVPGHVQFSLDIRSPQDEVVEAVEAECRDAFAAIASGRDVEGVNAGCAESDRQCSVEWRTDFDSPATYFHDDCIKCVQDAGAGLCGESEVSGLDIGSWGKFITSGAGHDSVYTSMRCPTTMVFVPCRDGVSHNPAEYSSPEACADGANVLMGAVLRYDQLRGQRGH
ncbi:putative peptidase M20, bacterial exopeptidase dimerization domain-containing protein [Septoria linicola]|nr:putative peptidase M20, bacterial exopeptidase dimerization domain-containing protein [Septoria linicola]